MCTAKLYLGITTNLTYGITNWTRNDVNHKRGINRQFANNKTISTECMFRKSLNIFIADQQTQF